MKKIYPILFFLFFAYVNVNAQQVMQLFNDDLYRLNYNPAAPVSQNYKGHVSILFSNLQVQANTNLLNLNDILNSKQLDLRSILKNTVKNNNIHTEINEEILGFGFRFGKKINNYFSVSYRMRGDVYGFIPGELSQTLINGTYTKLNETVKANINRNGSVYYELSVGYQHT